MYAAARPSTAAMGLLACVWRALECALRDCTAALDPRRADAQYKVDPRSYQKWNCLLTDICSPMKLLRTLPPLEAQPVIGIAVTLVRDIPADLYDELVKHPYEVQ